MQQRIEALERRMGGSKRGERISDILSDISLAMQEIAGSQQEVEAFLQLYTKHENLLIHDPPPASRPIRRDIILASLPTLPQTAQQAISILLTTLRR